ncbi:MAG: hypothetical protein AB7P40_06820 [Chloroflexota bacterium]
MHRPHGLILIVFILSLGIAIGLSSRSVYEMYQHERAQPDSAAIVAVPASAAIARTPTLQAVAAAPTRVMPTATLVPRDVVVEVTEAQLETQLNDVLVGQPLGNTPLGDATIQSVSVQLRDHLIQVGGGARAGFLQAPFLASGTIVPNSAGRPMVQVSQASVGGIELPEPVRESLAGSLQGHIDGLLTQQAVKIRTIDIADGKMRVVGTSGS